MWLLKWRRPKLCVSEGCGPQPHFDFIEVFGDPAVDHGNGTIERAWEGALNVDPIANVRPLHVQAGSISGQYPSHGDPESDGAARSQKCYRAVLVKNRPKWSSSTNQCAVAVRAG